MNLIEPKKLHGMRNVSKMSGSLPEGSCLQVSLDLADGEILGAVLPGKATQPWKRYQSPDIVPMLNTAGGMTPAEIKHAAYNTLGEYLVPDGRVRLLSKSAQAIREAWEQEQEALRKKDDEIRKKLKQLHTEKKISTEDYLAGNGMFDEDTEEGQVLYCRECRSDSCGNCQHIRYPIDDQMYPLLARLHAKGYETSSCCSGHAESRGMHYATYIAFPGRHDFEAPEGLVFTKGLPSENEINWISAAAPPDIAKQKVLFEEAREILERNLKSLENWIDTLPVKRKCV